MVCHQAVGVHLNTIPGFELGQRFEIALKITRFGKDDLAIMPTLDDMMWVVRQDGSAGPWHGGAP